MALLLLCKFITIIPIVSTPLKGSDIISASKAGISVCKIIDYYYYSLIVFRMEVQVQRTPPSVLLTSLVNSQNVVLLTIFISFLDDAQVGTLAEAARSMNRQEKFYKIIVAKHFMTCFLNRVDRSLFFLFYEDPLFATIERNTTNSLAANLHPYLLEAESRFQKAISLMKIQTNFLSSHQELQALVETVFFNPDLPLPKMKRETIAMFATTPFQQHLALMGEEAQMEWEEEPLEELREAVEEQVIQRTSKEWSSTERPVVEIVRYRGYLVGSKAEEYLLDGFRTHNLIVALLQLCSLVAQTSLTITANIQDPMMRFTEFLLRAAVFRNIVLSLEEKFLFLNKAYTEIHAREYNPPPAMPPFSLWRAALSIWLQQAKSHHARNEKIYIYVISKLREGNLLERVSERSDKMGSFYGQLKDALELQEFSDQAKAEAYFENGNKLQLEGFFQENIEIYEVIAKDYEDYFLDLSLNQNTVHWCGHSQQKNTSQHYTAHATVLIRQALRLCRFLREKIEESFPSELRIGILKELLREDLQFQLQKITSPSILRQIVEALNIEIRKIVSSSGLLGEQGIAKNLLQWDFAQKDDIVAYFAVKADIPEDCPSKMAFFYNLQDDPSAVPSSKCQGSMVSEGDSVYESEEDEVEEKEQL